MAQRFPCSERQRRFAQRGHAVAVLMDAGYTHWLREDGVTVRLLDLIEYDEFDAPASPLPEPPNG